ncbi:chemotaxis response regulator protein-glutamate methylesterase [Paenibacillus sp. L3-i20]|uniref:protein-glutamate methylesterase/protein-glutamine glutaminase n=1 Tax=Paenibacillus sp. L3-i20 TaxID=2905833 RepID=UPI001EDE6C7D|nr:chemotaxis response regulator protein-glutamate methylesterase [Paenibacillus sp. L3-i20]GKU78645.1 chemotaxis response regulator protein-glutamate methylesterase 3 [Paenibacillus sp. L3-i20]
MAPYRVLVVDDSAFMRKIISDLILQDDRFVIAATAVNGMEAVTAVAEHKPDVITMDLEMPVMNGIEALEHIMKSTPTPIIMLSGISEDNTRDTIKALQFGAFDFIHKPTSALSTDIHQVGEQLLEKLRVAVYTKRSRSAQVIDRPIQEIVPKVELQALNNEKKLHTPKQTPAPKAAVPLHNSIKETKTEIKAPLKPKTDVVFVASPKKVKEVEKKPAPLLPKLSDKKSNSIGNESTGQRKEKSTSFRHIVAIGTSTGGPRALHEVISSLPESFHAPVLIVQHMPPRFTKSLAQRLDSFSGLHVVEAEQGMKVNAGVAYIAPGGFHMELVKDGSGYAIRLTDQPQRNGHRPSVDVLFESLVPFKELARHAVIMTGMGSDGAKGMKLLAESGAVSTIAESEETCIVYGMPRAAVEMMAVQTVIPLQQIATKLMKVVLN